MIKITKENTIKLLDGSKIDATNEEINRMIYSDYTNLNIKVIEDHDMDLTLFYEDFKIPVTTMTEIPTEKLDILINKMGILIENSKEKKAYTFNIELIEEFIENTVAIILEELKKY